MNGNPLAIDFVSAFRSAAAPTATTVTSTNWAPGYGQPITSTATVNPASGSVQSGSVQFLIDGCDAGGPVALCDGCAALTTSSLAAGDHTVVAMYLGNTSFTASASPALTQGWA